jgi:hypothetical protein
MSTATTYTKDQQTMLALAFLSDAQSSKRINNKMASEMKCVADLNDNLAATIVNSKIGHWTCENVWIWVDDKQARNTIVIFSNQDNELVIGVAGTNFVNAYDWFVEDTETDSMLPWNKDIIHTQKENLIANSGYIAKGTAIALQKVWNLKDSGLDHSEPQIISGWLYQYLSENTNIDKVTVTGHSLGGAISPVLALALSENKNLWKPESAKNIDIKSYVFAGPTPGDQQFVSYVENNSDITIHSIYNKNDVVSHAWSLDMINKVSTLYSAELKNYIRVGEKKKVIDNIVKALVDWIREKSEIAIQTGHEYTRWTKEETFSGEIKKIYEIANIPYIIMMSVLKSDLKEEQYRESRESLCAICNVSIASSPDKQVEELKHYLSYFAKFMITLGVEHTDRYAEEVFNDTTFSNIIKAYNKACGSSFNGINVLMQLFSQIKEMELETMR